MLIYIIIALDVFLSLYYEGYHYMVDATENGTETSLARSIYH